ncbi:g6311 [Coccomyxa viridis]|uniref:G6311 protein n=1 Tax=Coccomyxa viridis TaxID=1274662 RepID=A0ABP1FV25_9CHLO
MAQELYSLDIVFQRSEELVQVLGVQPAVLIEILTREPGLLVVTPSQLGMRVMALKMSLPLLNVPELIRRHPKVLRSENGVSAVKRAVKDMNMLMPAYHVQERLLDDDGQMWMSFKERLMYWERQMLLAKASEP